MEENKTQSTPTESKETAISLIERAELANKKMEELLKKAEEIQARNILSGRSEAGITPKIIDAEELANQEALKLLQGTGLNPFKRANK